MSEPHVKYERRDINARHLVYFALITVALAVLMHVALTMLTGFFTRMDGVGEHPMAVSAYRPPEPRLQDDEAADVAALRREEAALLNSYGWVDRKKQRVHVPIDHAMEAIVKNGVPDWNEANGKNTEPKKNPVGPKTEAPK